MVNSLGAFSSEPGLESLGGHLKPSRCFAIACIAANTMCGGRLLWKFRSGSRTRRRNSSQRKRCDANHTSKIFFTMVLTMAQIEPRFVDIIVEKQVPYFFLRKERTSVFGNFPVFDSPVSR